jgi:predicted ATPase
MRAETETPLLERESSMASLHEYAGQARRGDGRLVLVAGEAGVGKSALVERLRWDLADARWSWGACDGLSTPRPLGPLFDLADQLGGDLAERCRAGADREDLFRVLLRQVAPPDVLDVVVIEDVHWADGATLDLVRFLGRRLREAHVLLIVTYRDDALAADDPLRVALGHLASHRSTRRIGLAPLSSRAVGRLAAERGLAGDELFRLTGGNPFLPDRDPARRHRGGSGVGPRCRAGAGGPARRRGPRDAGCRGAHGHPGRRAVAGVGHRRPAVDAG